MKKCVCIIASVLFFAALPAVSYGQDAGMDTNFGAALKMWMTKLSGDAVAGGGTNVDIIDDLGIDDEDNTFVLDLSFTGIPRSSLDFSFFSLEYSGSTGLGRSIDYQGVTYTLNEDISASASVDVMDVAYKLYPFTPTEQGFGFILGLMYAKAEAQISSERHGKATASADVPLPKIGVTLNGMAGPVRLSGEVSGFSLSYSDISGEMWEVDVSAEYDVTANAGVIGGYRYIFIEGEEDDDSVEMQIGGLYLGGIVRF